MAPMIEDLQFLASLFFAPFSKRGVAFDATRATIKRPVFLLHGLGIDDRIWTAGFREHLHTSGYTPIPLVYPSSRGTIEDHAHKIRRDLESLGLLERPAAWFCHSLGGLIFLRLLAEVPSLSPTLAVMISSPLRGSRLAHRVSHSPLGRLSRRLLGPSFQQLADLWQEETPFSPPPSSFPLVVLHGQRTFHPFEPASWLGRVLLPRHLAHDGVVCEDELHVPSSSSVHRLSFSHNRLLQTKEFFRLATDLLEQEARWP